MMSAYSDVSLHCHKENGSQKPDSGSVPDLPAAAAELNTALLHNDKEKTASFAPSVEPYRGNWVRYATREDIVTILENVPCGVFVVEGPLGESLYINPECVRISGYDLQDVPTALVAREILFPDQKTRQALAKRHEQMINGSDPEPFLSGIVCKNGQRKICETRIIGLPNGKLVGVWTDVTRREMAETELRSREEALVKAKEELEDRVKARTSELTRLNKELKKSRSELQLLSEHLHRAREEERTHVAREVHDELGQLLTALKMELAYCGQHLHENQPSVSDHIEAMEQQIDTGIDTVRKICSALRPHVLERLGLLAGIEWYVRGFEKRTGMQCTVTTSHELPDLDKDLSLVLFRVLQEAMTNVARHAGATQIQVVLKMKEALLVLKIKDNGRGISRKDTANPGSFGIIGIRERIRAWGGKSTFFGTPHTGTTVTITIPLSPRLGLNSRKREGQSKKQGLQRP